MLANKACNLLFHERFCSYFYACALVELHFTSLEPEIWADLGPEMADLRPVKAYLRLKGLNQLLKGNMWSAIPVALLCMLVIVGDG